MKSKITLLFLIGLIQMMGNSAVYGMPFPPESGVTAEVVHDVSDGHPIDTPGHAVVFNDNVHPSTEHPSSISGALHLQPNEVADRQLPKDKGVPSRAQIAMGTLLTTGGVASVPLAVMLAVEVEEKKKLEKKLRQGQQGNNQNPIITNDHLPSEPITTKPVPSKNDGFFSDQLTPAK